MGEIRVSEDGDLQSEGRRRRHKGHMLRALVKQEGWMGAVRLLGVNYKMVVCAEEPTHIHGRVGRRLRYCSSGRRAPTCWGMRPWMGVLLV